MMLPKQTPMMASLDEDSLVQANSGTIKLQKNYLDCENFDALPMTFTGKTKEQWHKLDNCELCNQPFKFMVRN